METTHHRREDPPRFHTATLRECSKRHLPNLGRKIELDEHRQMERPAMMTDAWARTFAPFIGKDRLEIGSGAHPTPEWVTLDINPDVRPHYLHDLSTPLPFSPATFDTILAS